MLTTEQIVALAPDSSTAKNGRGLAKPAKWTTTGHNPQAVWGECLGSGKQPYQVQIDLATGDMGHRCSCPSRKQPCKHIIGLLLLLAEEPGAVPAVADPPAWVGDWLQRRAQRAQQRSDKQQRGGQVVDPAAQAKRAAEREAGIRSGLEDLELWVSDLVRQGLAHAQNQPASFWETQAARMVDAKAPGVARMLREMASLPASGAGWEGRLLARLSQLYLLIQGYKRLEHLPPDQQDTIRVAVGLPVKEDDLLTQSGTRDRWLIIGQSLDVEEKLKSQRTWLYGATTHQPALILDFAFGPTPLDRSLIVGTALDAELVFFPGSTPLRAIVKQRHGALTPFASSETSFAPAQVSAALGEYAAALARNPWIGPLPLLLREVVLLHQEHRWLLRDAGGDLLPVASRFAHGWHLLALSGGQPVTVAGEWDGQDFLPLGAAVNGSYCILEARQGE